MVAPFHSSLGGILVLHSSTDYMWLLDWLHFMLLFPWNIAHYCVVLVTQLTYSMDTAQILDNFFSKICINFGRSFIKISNSFWICETSM